MGNELMSTVVYIASDTRSGSTLLDMILNTDPSVVSLGESKMLYEYYNNILNAKRRDGYCSCGKKVSECEFWDKINSQIQLDYNMSISELLTRYDKPKLLRSKFNLTKKECYDLVTKSMKIIYDSVFKVTTCKVIIDSSKKFDHLKNCSEATDNIKVIKLIRDGRGVVTSKKKRNNIDVIRASYFWVRNNKRIDKAIKDLSITNVLTIKYEDLCNNLEETIKKLSAFTGVSDIDLDVVPKMEIHNIAGSPHKSSREKFEIKEDTKWRNKMSLWDKIVFLIIGGWYQKKNGYRMINFI